MVSLEILSPDVHLYPRSQLLPNLSTLVTRLLVDPTRCAKNATMRDPVPVYRNISAILTPDAGQNVSSTQIVREIRLVLTTNVKILVPERAG